MERVSWGQQTPQDTLRLSQSRLSGLSLEEAKERRLQPGKPKRLSWWSPIARAQAAIEKRLPHFARVRRDGADVVIPVEELVVGDILLLRAGEQSPVEGRPLRTEDAQEIIVTALHEGVFAGGIIQESLPWLTKVRLARLAKRLLRHGVLVRRWSSILEFAALSVVLVNEAADIQVYRLRLREYGLRMVLVTNDYLEPALHEREMITGEQLRGLSDQEVLARLPTLRLIVCVLPRDKARVVRLYQARGLSVGFLGNGIVDREALLAADVGMVMADDVDIPQEGTDILLLSNPFSALLRLAAEARRF